LPIIRTHSLDIAIPGDSYLKTPAHACPTKPSLMNIWPARLYKALHSMYVLATLTLQNVLYWQLTIFSHSCSSTYTYLLGV